MFVKKRECFIPRRQMSWKRYSYLRSREENVFYDCQCGKRYFSFPAIFLHFQRKHSRKISINHDYPEFELRSQQKQQIYFFFISKKRNIVGRGANQDYCRAKKKYDEGLTSLFVKFVQDNKEQLKIYMHLPFLKKMLVGFSNFVVQKCENSESQKSGLEQIMKILPNYFNDFMLHQLCSSQFSSQHNYLCSCCVFLKLGSWLNKNNFSDLIVEINRQDPC